MDIKDYSDDTESTRLIVSGIEKRMKYNEYEAQEFGQFLITYLPLNVQNALCESLRGSSDCNIIQMAIDNLNL